MAWDKVYTTDENGVNRVRTLLAALKVEVDHVKLFDEDGEEYEGDLVDLLEVEDNFWKDIVIGVPPMDSEVDDEPPPIQLVSGPTEEYPEGDNE
jgi:hypothetical protein